MTGGYEKAVTGVMPCSYLFTEQLNVQAAPTQACDNTAISTAFSDIFLLPLPFGRVGKLFEHQFFL